MDTASSELSIGGQRNAYQTINISGNARAILGNVASDTFSFHHGSNVDWRNTLKALYFEGMRTRKAQIARRAGSPEHVEWIWRTHFVDWLNNDQSFFWMTGRAGSGKSTLMKHIADSRKTKQHLERNGENWTVTHFFFDFRAGSGTANSLEGMLRSLLYQLVQRCPDLAQNIDSISYDEFSSLDTISCLDFVCQVANAASSKICAFVDGLDEFEGSGIDLVDTIRSLEDKAGFKLCLASRPYRIFESNFSTYANLTVQDFNDESIQMYVRAQWNNQRLGVQASLPEVLGNKIRDKAGGVFLWARLAIDELLQDLLRGVSITVLESQLEQMPKEVEDMYQRILDRVPTIMRLETAALLYMIMSSNSRETQVRKLYTVLDSFTRRQSMESEIQILPVDLVDEEGLVSRIVNVLGDFVDVSTNLESYIGYSSEPEHKELMPVVVMHKNELTLQKGPASEVSLTYETLRAFLNGNAWLRSYIPADIGKIAPRYLWIDIYLREMEFAASNSSSDVDRVRSIVRSFVQQAYTFLWDEKWDEIDRMRESLLDVLRTWPTWTPLLLLAIQDLFREVLRCQSLDTVDAQRIGRILQTQLMQYHLAICQFQSCSPAALKYNYFRDHEEICPDIASINHCTYALPNKLYDHANAIGWDNFFSICHGLPEIVLHSQIFDGNQGEGVERIQILFDYVWTKILKEKSGGRPYSLLIDRLVSAGARLRGSHVCSFLRHRYRHHEDSLLTFFGSDLCIELAHADDCKLKGHKDTSSTFLWHWVQFFDDTHSEEGSNMSELILKFLLRCGVQINARFKGEPLLNMLLATGRYRVVYMVDRMKKVVIALRAGADPSLTGKNGDAIEAAFALKSVVNVHSVDYYQEQIQAVSKIVDMLKEYFDKGGLTEQRLDAYACFNYRRHFLSRNDPRELNPYRLFKLDK